MITTVDSRIRVPVCILSSCPPLQGADASSSIAKATTSGGLHQASWKEQGKAPPINELITVSTTTAVYESTFA